MNTQAHLKEKDTGYNSKNKLSEISEDEIKDAIHDIGKKVGGKASDATESAIGHYQSSRMYVRKHPVTGVFAATAVGMVLGSILTAALRK